MKIAIIVAMAKELALLLPLLSGETNIEIAGKTFYQGTVGNHEVVVMQCGIGKVNAAMGTTLLISNFHPDCVINTGVAGGGDLSVSVMDIVAASQVAYHDVWCGPESELGRVQGLPLYYDCDSALLAALPNHPNLKKGLICSGDQFIDNIEQVKRIKSIFPQALALDMESGAIAQVCHVQHVPFLSLRVISDSPGASHNNTQQYTDFWESAPQQTFEVVRTLIHNLK